MFGISLLVIRTAVIRDFLIRESSALGYVSNREVVLTFSNEKSITLSMLYMKKNEKSKVMILQRNILEIKGKDLFLLVSWKAIKLGGDVNG
jgi:hypothetical protein